VSHHINLYDPALRQQKQWLTAANLLFAVALLFLTLLGWGVWLRVQGGGLAAGAAALDGQTQAARDESVALGNQLASRKPDPKLETDLAAMKELLGVRQGILDALGQGAAQNAAGHADYLRGLARQSVGGLWLTSFAVSAGGARMEIRGRTLDPALLPEYIRRLNAEPAFRGHRFAALTMAVPATPPTTSAASAGSMVAPAKAPASPLYHEFALVPDNEPRRPGGAQ
jgi:hypothetical protein